MHNLLTVFCSYFAFSIKKESSRVIERKPHMDQLNSIGDPVGNRAYPENNNFETFVPRNLKFHTLGDLRKIKKCKNFNWIP